jgi:alpha-beta hydrolase superfamily lysophospholipase
VVGHGAGGLVAEALLAMDVSSAAIALAPTYPGLLARLPLAGSWSGRDLPMRAPRAVMPSKEQFRRDFANTLSSDDADRLHDRYVIPASHRALARGRTAARWARKPGAHSRGPLLLVSGGRNAFTREAQVSRLQRGYRERLPDVVTDHHVFPDRGHSLVIDAGWQDVAYYCLDWLTRQDL